MITAANYEQSMKMRQANIINGFDAEKEQRKALEETLEVLKQFGFDAGADYFESIMRNKT